LKKEAKNFCSGGARPPCRLGQTLVCPNRQVAPAPPEQKFFAALFSQKSAYLLALLGGSPRFGQPVHLYVRMTCNLNKLLIFVV
jgi:hypothetical protein